MWRGGNRQNYEVNSCRWEPRSSMLKLNLALFQVLEGQYLTARFDKVLYIILSISRRGNLWFSSTSVGIVRGVFQFKPCKTCEI